MFSQVSSMITRMFSALILAVFVMSCGVTIEPIEQRKLVTAPDNIRIKFDRVTNKPVLNLIPIAEMDRRAKRELDAALIEYQMMGFERISSLSDPRYRRLKLIFDKVHRYTHLKDRDIEVVLIEMPIFQAYTFGGGAVVFYTGLTDILNDDQLAGVIGHEIAHIAAGHIAEETSRSLVNTDTGTMTTLTGFYSLTAEKEADQIGLVYTALAGYAPQEMSTFWQGQAAQQGKNILNPFADSHPTYQDRAFYLKQDAEKLNGLGSDLDENQRQKLVICNPIYCRQ